jgi:Tfp pilus assembly protein PilW
MKQKGFTIIEFLIYSALLLIFLYIMTGLFTQILDTQLLSESTSPLTQDSRYIFARLTYDIRRATSIATPSAIGQQTSTLGLVIGGQSYAYAPVGLTLTESDPTGTRALNSYGTQVSNLSFRRYGNVGGKPSIRVILTLTGVASSSSGVHTQDFSATIGQL